MTSIAASVPAPSTANTDSRIHAGDGEHGIYTPKEVSAQWLSDRLGTLVESFSYEKIGTGQVSCCHRFKLKYAEGNSGPASIVLKTASEDIDSRTSAKLLGLYQREVFFYLEAAPKIPGGPVAKVYHSSYDEEDDRCCILLEDVTPSVVGNDIDGCTLEQARLAMESLGKIHEPFINNSEFQSKSWLNRPVQLPPAMFEQLGKAFLQQYDERIKPEHKEIVKRLVAGYSTYQGSQLGIFNPMGVVHADYRGDNILWRQSDDGNSISATAVDWQTIIWGPVIMDVAYFLGCSLSTTNRRAWEDELLDIYLKALGTVKFTKEQCAESLKLQTFFGLLMAIVSPMLVQRTDRGDDLFMVLLDRHCNHILDRGALDMLPQVDKQVPLKPAVEDDAKIHPPGPENHWQESWYFDFADPKQEIGGYIRLGADPAKNRSWYTATICGPNRPTIAIVDFDAPLPDENLSVKGERFIAEQQCKDPMKQYRVAVNASTAEVFDDPSELLRGNKGKPIAASMDLLWDTDGEPYAYRLATRYEIPCRVSGTLTIGDEVIQLSNVLGQRDHSWGSRDWWAMDWVWNATHLDDGTHIHSLDLRIPKTPRLACGYVQGPEQEITEIESCIVEETFLENDLPTTTPTTIQIEGGSIIKLDMTIMGHGPLKLTSDDGRIDLFPRAWGIVRTEDGRSGVAWMEWNRNKYGGKFFNEL